MHKGDVVRYWSMMKWLCQRLMAVILCTMSAALSLHADLTNEDTQTWFERGLQYEQGDGVAQDDSEAAYWYRKAAEQGHALAQGWLGVMYEQGKGVRQDDIEAAHWL
ncbi:MAG: tetratricopeptide repeat protein, partial [Pseudomonadota bacterium]